MISTAEKLVRSRDASQSDLKRGVSTAYYAVFHEVCHIVATTVFGGSAADKETAEWQRAFRALDHGRARKVFSAISARAGPETGVLRQFCTLFLNLQDQRERADYDPAATYGRDEARELVRSASRALFTIDLIAEEDRRRLCADLLFPRRS